MESSRRELSARSNVALEMSLSVAQSGTGRGPSAPGPPPPPSSPIAESAKRIEERVSLAFSLVRNFPSSEELEAARRVKCQVAAERERSRGPLGNPVKS